MSILGLFLLFLFDLSGLLTLILCHCGRHQCPSVLADQALTVFRCWMTSTSGAGLSSWAFRRNRKQCAEPGLWHGIPMRSDKCTDYSLLRLRFFTYKVKGLDKTMFLVSSSVYDLRPRLGWLLLTGQA